MAIQKIPLLEKLASEVIGDGKSPELYFVGDEGVIVMVSRWFRPAYEMWRYLARQSPRRPCSLESRKVGVLASVDEDEESGKLVMRDDTDWVIKKGWIKGSSYHLEEL